MKRRLVARVSGLIPRRGRPVSFAYGYADLGVLFGISVAAVRKLVARGRFDPGDLRSVAAYGAKLAAERQRRADRSEGATT